MIVAGGWTNWGGPGLQNRNMIYCPLSAKASRPGRLLTDVSDVDSLRPDRVRASVSDTRVRSGRSGQAIVLATGDSKVTPSCSNGSWRWVDDMRSAATRGRWARLPLFSAPGAASRHLSASLSHAASPVRGRPRCSSAHAVLLRLRCPR